MVWMKMIDSEKKFFLVVAIIILAIFWFGHEMGKQTIDSQLKEDLKQCELEKETLETQTSDLKQDIAELLIESYAKPFVWDIFGATKYKKMECELKVL